MSSLRIIPGPRSTRLRRLAVSLCAPAIFCAAQTPTPPQPTPVKPSAAIPATAPTASPAAPAPQAAPPEQPHHPANVVWQNNQLQIQADNSSLNGILRQVSLRTGMKIHGGVVEESVYGSYGPASAAVVLAQLLDGTGSNVMLQSDTAMQPLTLTLTPRNGGPTPPDPMALRREEEEERRQEHEDRHDLVTDRLHHLPPSAAAQNTPTQLPTPDAAPAAPPSGDTTTQPSPNGAKTPEQVMQDLQRLQHAGGAATPSQ